LGTYTNAAVDLGQGTVFSPTSPPDDNVSISSFTANILPSFGGSLNSDPATGVITVSNASPEGTYTITATVTDNCAAATERQMELEVMGDGIFEDGFELLEQM
jgi:hypothetical protein